MDKKETITSQVISLGRRLEIGPGDTVELSCPKTSILSVAFRIRTTGPVKVMLQEYKNSSWQITGTLEALEGETVWQSMLRSPKFRLLLNNPSPDEKVTVTVDANLPRRVKIET